MKHFLLLITVFLLKNVAAQNVGIGTTTPLARLHVADSSVVFTGPATLPATPANPSISGTGVRMMWYPDKAAFRAGALLQDITAPNAGTYWNKDSIGLISFATGLNTKAKGDYSIAMGDYSQAIGSSSTAIGHRTLANGEGSTALGEATKSDGIYSFAVGNSTLAKGDISTAMGHYTKATALYSTAMGYISEANGVGSTAMGYLTQANGIASTAMGNYTEANNTYSTAVGYHSIASGYGSTAVGDYTKANGYFSLVAGRYNDTIVASQNAVSTTTPLFIIGNGNSNADRTNAFVVLKNGYVAIGDNGNPVNKLQITGTITNTSLLDNSGMMTLGYTSSTNMVFDQNDIQVRLGGDTSDLYLQRLGGRIGIGNTGTPAYQLELSRNSAGKPGTNTWSIASDSRLKQNINPYTDGLQQLMQIRPVTYHYNEQSGYDTRPEYVGIIAQDLQKIAPYMVGTVKREKGDFLSVDNGAMTYMLINAVKELKLQIEMLQVEIQALKLKIPQ